MTITASMVKDLRTRTAAGMMDCKRALTQAEGDMDLAIEILRKNGQAKAEKRAGRVAAEGLVLSAVKNDHQAAIVEVNSETDFVANTEKFISFAKSVAKQALFSDSADMDIFLTEAWNEDPKETVKEALVQQIAVIGENLTIRRFEKIVTDGCVVSYIHHGGRIGVLVDADTDVVNEKIRACLRNVAMQVAAMDPKYLSAEQVGDDYLDHEKEIMLAQTQKENPGKPANLIEKIAQGRVKKELKEICLLDQTYVKDNTLTVGDYIHKVAKENSAHIALKKYVRYETGENLEKRTCKAPGAQL